MLPELPNLPELPVIKEANLTTLRIDSKRLPAMPAGETGNLSYNNFREQQVAKEMYAIKRATEERKAQEMRSRAVARAKGRAAQRWAEGR